MVSGIDDLKREIKKRLENIVFRNHFYLQARKRSYLNKSLVIRTLRDFDNYLGFQKQNFKGELRYRIGVKLSNRYSLIIVLVFSEESLNIITYIANYGYNNSNQ